MPRFDRLLPKLSDLPDDGIYRLEIPVIDLGHLPPAEREGLLEFRSWMNGVFAIHDSPTWTIVLHTNHGFMSGTRQTLPALTAMLETLAARGFAYVRFDPECGTQFEDLPTYDHDELVQRVKVDGGFGTLPHTRHQS